MEIEEAVEILLDHTDSIEETETLAAEAALGRILAADIRAGFDQPPFPRSPLDGYAVRGEDTTGASEEIPVTLTVTGKVYAGGVADVTVHPMEAVRIMTGAPIPEGANAVIRQEDTDLGTEKVQIYKGVAPHANYCEKGEDFRTGDVLLKAGTRITSGILAVIAALGVETVEVYRRPKVAVFASGDELQLPGEPLRPGKIYESNNSYICARLMEFGIPALERAYVEDRPQVMADHIKRAIDDNGADFVITTGSVSVGEKDIMHEVLRILGAEQLFWKIRVKPGSPTLAFVYHGKVVLALSGNPFGAIANFELLARPILAKMGRRDDIAMKTATCVLNDEIRKRSDMRRYLRGWRDGNEVRLSERLQTSGAIAGMAKCNCMILVPESKDGVVAGEEVTVCLF